VGETISDAASVVIEKLGKPVLQYLDRKDGISR